MQTSSSGHFPTEPRIVVTGELRQTCLEALEELLKARRGRFGTGTRLTFFITGRLAESVEASQPV